MGGAWEAFESGIMRRDRASGVRVRSHQLLLILLEMVLVERDSACVLYLDHVGCRANGLTEPPRDFLHANITNLDLSFNLIAHLSPASLPPLPYLQVLLLGLQLEGKGQVVVEDLAFAAFPRLRWLDLGGNGLLVLKPQALWGLHELEKLHLDYNGLGNEVLEGDFFRDLFSLQELDLTGNRLRRARPGRAFISMETLRVIKLQSNVKLESMCEGDLAMLSGRHLELLDLSNTRMFQDTSFNWTECGNPLCNLSLGTLDISSTTMGSNGLQHFLDSIHGVPVKSLNMRSLPNVGSSFGFANILDPVREWFLGLEESGVEALDFSKNNILSLHPRVFSAFPAVRTMDLSRNKVNEIEAGAFQGLTSLVFLNLSNNLLGEIYKKSFKDLMTSLVEHIDLSHNHIGIIQSGTFEGFPHLATLDLRDNGLQRLPLLPSLSFLILRDNRLVDLHGLQSMQQNLRFLDVTRNRLRDLGELCGAIALSHMQYLLFAENMFVYCTSRPTTPGPGNNSLIYLDLGGNAMQATWIRGSCTDMFHSLGALQKLFLDRNMLTALPDGLFLGLSSLLTLNLSNNHLSSVSAASLAPLINLNVLDVAWNRLVVLDPASLGPMASLQLLDLRGNPFHCTCELTPLLAWLNRAANSTAVNAFPEALLCASPANLNAVPLAWLNSDDCEEEDPRVVQRLRISLLCVSASATLLLLIAAVGHRCCRRHFHRSLVWIRSLLLTRGWGASPEAKAKIGGAEFSYDAFVCHSEVDLPWVRSELLRRLDLREGRGGPLSVCLEARDFVPGEAYMDNLVRAVDSSRCTLCVLTHRFLEDSWCMEALRLAQGRGGTRAGHQDAVVLLLLGPVPEYQLHKHVPVRAHLQAGRPFVHWPEDPQDRGWCADLLVATIRKKALRERPQGNTQWYSMQPMIPVVPLA